MRRIVLMAVAVILMVALAAPAAFAAEKKDDANKNADGDLNRKQENRLERKLDKAQQSSAEDVVYLVDADIDLEDLYDFDNFYAYGQTYSNLDLLDCPFWGDYEGIVNQYDCYS